MNCSICEVPIAAKESCNAQPVNDGRCCQACDDLIVTPVRIARAHRLKIEATISDAVALHDKMKQLRKSLLCLK